MVYPKQEYRHTARDEPYVKLDWHWYELPDEDADYRGAMGELYWHDSNSMDLLKENRIKWGLDQIWDDYHSLLEENNFIDKFPEVKDEFIKYLDAVDDVKHLERKHNTEIKNARQKLKSAFMKHYMDEVIEYTERALEDNHEYLRGSTIRILWPETEPLFKHHRELQHDLFNNEDHEDDDEWRQDMEIEIEGIEKKIFEIIKKN